MRVTPKLVWRAASNQPQLVHRSSRSFSETIPAAISQLLSRWEPSARGRAVHEIEIVVANPRREKPPARIMVLLCSALSSSSTQLTDRSCIRLTHHTSWSDVARRYPRQRGKVDL